MEEGVRHRFDQAKSFIETVYCKTLILVSALWSCILNGAANLDFTLHL